MVSTIVVRSFEDLEPYRPTWEALARGMGAAQPFVSFDWLMTCARTGSHRLHPYVVVARNGQSVLAIGPFARLGMLPGRRRLVFLGMGPSDYQTVLAESTAADAVKAVWDAVLEQSDWDWIDLDPAGEPDARQAASWLEGRDSMRVAYTEKGSRPVLRLEDDLETSVSSRLRKQAQYERGRLERMGMLEWRAPHDGPALRQVLGDLMALHTRRWAAGARPSRFADPAIRRRWFALMDVWRAQGFLHVRGLYLDGRMIAGHAGAQTAQRFYYHTPAFDPAFHKHSPGKVLLWELLQECRRHGVTWFDFLRGDETYKLRWGAERGQPYGRLRITRDRVLGNALPAVADRLGGWVGRSARLRRAVGALKPLIGE